ncbi:Carboxylesterase [Exophiala viscosa]|uniref:Carboxylesterase n=1 Tax=Exophiala viscosa TaxID=2486360 RepID=UPI00219D4F36|nr:Carboxylesterase [Exophiala viscosa]
MKITQYFPSLQSDITGEYDEDNGLAYFRGIPYASVNKRWTHSNLLQTLENPFDATQFGPRCVQEEGEVLVSGGTNDPTPGDDEFDCLNLNITVPRECLQQFENGHTKIKVPVMFWIHGGGFKYGANSVARYRPHRLCSIARQAGHPVILVQIGYRLGALGFAASEDLVAEQTQHGEEAKSLPIGNYGFVDQRNALKWVQNHIRDFGGDPDNVTAFGISAGSASVHYHILTGDPMFDRAICMSGSAPTLGPLPFERYRKAWLDLCLKKGLEGETAEARLSKLRAMSPLDILANYSAAAMGPMGDGVLLPKTWTFEQSNPTRCRSLIIGDTNVEGLILDGLARRLKPSQVLRLARTVMSEVEVKEFQEVFALSADDEQPWEVYRDTMRRFFSIMMFQFPNLRIAETFRATGGEEAYLYHFGEASPYPGPTFGLSYHGQCALYMYCVEMDALPIESQQLAENMARTWTAFAHGARPWEPYTDKEQFMRFGPQGKCALADLHSDDTRDYGHVDWLREHFEPAKQLAQLLLS